MNLIVAVDKNWAIGKQNKLLVSIPADMRFFREHTTNKVVIMGKNTLESFPGSKPLKDRTNIVIALEEDYKVEGAVVVNSIEEAVEAVSAYPSGDVYVIGGASIYRQMLDYCDKAYVTKINFAYEADTHFPDLDKMPDWQLTEESGEQTYYDLVYQYCVYEKK